MPQQNSTKKKKKAPPQSGKKAQKRILFVVIKPKNKAKINIQNYSRKSPTARR